MQTPPLDTADLELDMLLAAVAARWGYDFRGYARASLQRRVAQAVEVAGERHVAALIERVLHDDGYIDEFLSSMFVSYTEFFRDPAVFREMCDVVLPDLATYPRPKIWHAGCASGEEVYSLAMLLAEAGLLQRTTIYATDINLAALRTARMGVYRLGDVVRQERAYRESGGKRSIRDYCMTREPADGCHDVLDAGCVMPAALRDRIIWSPHDLVRDGPFSEVNLVLCRNTLIYFGRPLQDRVLSVLHASLASRGILALGTQETIQHSALASAFDGVGRHKLYRRRLPGARPRASSASGRRLGGVPS